jgi:hypothetical protein
VPALAWRDGCGWPESFTFTIPTNAKPGVYSAKCTDISGDFTHICVVVRPKATARGEIAVLANTNAWNSYNEFGGRSKYFVPTGTVLSFERPNPGITPIEYNVIDHLLRAELWLLNWLEDEAYGGSVAISSPGSPFGCCFKRWMTGSYGASAETLKETFLPGATLSGVA